MNTQIKILADNIINKIAAGEVVERPASVVKELVENALDAGARSIVVRLLAGGKQAITVSDDGKGMSRDDLKMCYLRHATSKMSSPSDLFNIGTLGFRGEALASIGAVSYMTIETRRKEETEGTRLAIEGGVEREFHAVGRAIGTTIAVRQLFFNTPARRKFLRHVDTEARHIHGAIIQLAAAYPEVEFSLEHQDRSALRFSGATRLERAVDLLGIVRSDLVELNSQREGIQLYGAIGRPNVSQKTKSKQFLIVRGRPIYSRSLNEALYRGYAQRLPAGNHPAFICWLEMDPRQIDVNVHPAKREIRIANERAVVDIIQDSVREALSMGEEQPFVFSAARPIEFNPSTDTVGKTVVRDQGGGLDAEPSLHENALEHINRAQDEDVAKQGTLMFQGGGDEQTERDRQAPEHVWQVHKRYLISPLRDSLLVVDQQAAHERILYEEARKKQRGDKREIQQLLFPIVLRLGREEHALALYLLELLQEVGFDVRDFGENAVVVDGVPGEMKNWNEGSALRQILADMDESTAVQPDELREKLLISYARHSAIKEGAVLDESEMQSIVKRLMECEEPYFCPRGKPTVIKVLKRDLDKLFGRS